MEAHQKSALEQFPNFEANIGIEVHLQLKTNTKIFCGCPNRFGDEPNSNICQICCGHPGVLPVLNRKVVDYAIMAGLATGCSISRVSDFARKHYMYPDLPKNYQITQSDKPICYDGGISIDCEDGSQKTVRLIRIHMEEDAGKNLHTNKGHSLVNINRAGTPLLEIVSHPDMSNSSEARAYLTQLHSIMRYLEISDANMEEGSFRADINISVRPKDQKELGTKVELKNINSFRFIVQAIEFEIERQVQMLQNGDRIFQETRLWDNKKQQSFFMRSKEEAQDYRYFTEPDLAELQINEEWINKIRATLPELPTQKRTRFIKNYDLSLYEATIIVEEKERAEFFEKSVAINKNPKLTCNWMLRDVLSFLKEKKEELSTSKITPELFAELITALADGVINSSTAQVVFIELATNGTSPNKFIEDNNLKQIGSVDEIETIAKEILVKNQQSVDDYRSGKTKLFGFFVGQVMKATQGKANPSVINEILTKLLG